MILPLLLYISVPLGVWLLMKAVTETLFLRFLSPRTTWSTSTKVCHCQQCSLVFYCNGYLASDGQHLYLHPINTKSLTKVLSVILVVYLTYAYKNSVQLSETPRFSSFEINFVIVIPLDFVYRVKPQHVCFWSLIVHFFPQCFIRIPKVAGLLNFVKLSSQIL